MSKPKDPKTERLEMTRHLQFQISNAHDEIEQTQIKISTMETARDFGEKLTRLRNHLEYWKGRRDTLQEIWNFRNKEF